MIQGLMRKQKKIGETFEENSSVKAEAVKAFCNKNGIKKMIVADDAGLMVDALRRKTTVYIQQGMAETMHHKRWF